MSIIDLLRLDRFKNKNLHRDNVKAERKYVNHFDIGHNAFEFLIDIGQLFANNQTLNIHTRLITSPFYAKVLLTILTDAINRYEANFGPIEDEKR